MYDICIIGGGASGMAAAISAAMENPEARICIMEKKGNLGKKLVATGNGRCNITNLACPNVRETVDFFRKIGVALEEDRDGWMYPISRQAEDVVCAMESAIRRYNIDVMVNKSVEKVGCVDEGFFLNDEIRSDRVLLAVGGKAGPQYGTTGDGYGLARSMGHRVTRLAPVLTALDGKETKELQGVRVRGSLSLMCKDQVISREEGEVQFTPHGVSGICVFNLSRFVRLDSDTDFQDYRLQIDFLPRLSKQEVEEIILQRKAAGADLIRSLVPSKLCRKIYETASTPLELTGALKDYRVDITGARGWKWAQCTSGGVAWEEIHPDSLESKLVEGLYFAGEILDYDGPCGGYNLQNAWETGMKAGREMAWRK